jgi:hypothetical protein
MDDVEQWKCDFVNNEDYYVEIFLNGVNMLAERH